MKSGEFEAGRPMVVTACHWQAVRQAARRMTGLYDAALAPHGLRISQFAILSRLARLGPMSMHRLAQELLLDRTTLGRNLIPLERDGLVESVAHASDRRIRLVSVTAGGRARVHEALPAWEGAQAAFERQIGVSTAANLRAELHRVTSMLDAGPPDTPES